jgi:hypothetical protein
VCAQPKRQQPHHHPLIGLTGMTGHGQLVIGVVAVIDIRDAEFDFEHCCRKGHVIVSTLVVFPERLARNHATTPGQPRREWPDAAPAWAAVARRSPVARCRRGEQSALRSTSVRHHHGSVRRPAPTPSHPGPHKRDLRLLEFHVHCRCPELRRQRRSHSISTPRNLTFVPTPLEDAVASLRTRVIRQSQCTARIASPSWWAAYQQISAIT